MPKLLLIPLLTLSIMFAQPQEAGASGAVGHYDANGNWVAKDGVPDNYMFIFGSMIGYSLAGVIIPTTAISLARYKKDPAMQKTVVPYLGAVAGSMAIGLGTWLLVYSTTTTKVHWGYPPVLAAGIASTAIGIHSIRRIKKARAAKKVSFHGITPTLLGSSKVEGMGLNVSLGWR